MSDIVYTADIRVDRLRGPHRHAWLPAHDGPVEFGVHGAINPCNWGCRQGAGARGLIERALGDAGVPVLNLEVDCVDPRSFSEGQLRTRVEAFVEMLSARRATGSTAEQHSRAEQRS